MDLPRRFRRFARLLWSLLLLFRAVILIGRRVCRACRLFGFVARKLGGRPTDNACHVFAELEAEQPAEAVASFVMKIMLGHGRRRT